MDFLIFWLSNVPGFATPFALGVLGMIICERSGVLNLGAEGFVLVGAMSGAGVLISVGDLPLFYGNSWIIWFPTRYIIWFFSHDT